MDGWQDISTAPKNKAVLAASGGHVGEACLISWEDGLHGWYWAEDRSAMTTAPDFWMPLPATPKQD